MHQSYNTGDSSSMDSLQKVPVAARRMGVSVSQFYRIAKRDGLRIIKVSERASAVPQSDVDAWIQERIAAHGAAAGSSRRGGA